MANLTTSMDLLQDGLFRAGEATDGTSDFDAAARRYLHRGYRAVWMGGNELDNQVNETWWWLLASGSLILQPSYKTDTVQVTNNDTSIVFATAPTDSKAGWFFKVDDHPDIFKISSHTGGVTSATLDTVYTGDDDTAASFRVFQTQYDIASDVLKIVGPMRAYQENRYDIIGTSIRDLKDKYPLRLINSGVPDRFAFIDSDSIQFSHYGDDNGDLIRIDYDYMKVPDDLDPDTSTDEPLIPKHYRGILSDYVAWMVLNDKDDSRANEVAAHAVATLKSMSAENRQKWAGIGEPGAIYSRLGDMPWNMSGRRILRTESGHIIG